MTKFRRLWADDDSFNSNFVGEKTELTVEDKYKKTMKEIECLKVELGNVQLLIIRQNLGDTLFFNLVGY